MESRSDGVIDRIHVCIRVPAARSLVGLSDQPSLAAELPITVTRNDEGDRHVWTRSSLMASPAIDTSYRASFPAKPTRSRSVGAKSAGRLPQRLAAWRRCSLDTVFSPGRTAWSRTVLDERKDARVPSWPRLRAGRLQLVLPAVCLRRFGQSGAKYDASRDGVGPQDGVFEYARALLAWLRQVARRALRGAVTLSKSSNPPLFVQRRQCEFFARREFAS